MNDLTDKASARISEARAAAEEKLKAARERAYATGERAKVRATKTSTAARAKARKATKQAKSGIEHNPIFALAGGLAIGAIAAALLPHTAQEDKVAGKVGKRARQTAAQAAKAATTRGKAQLDALGVNSNAARDQVKDLIGKLAKAATSAATAAGDSVKKKK